MPFDLYAPAIITLRNTGTELSISLHTYGRHINFTDRSEFDPSRNIERPFNVSVSQ